MCFSFVFASHLYFIWLNAKRVTSLFFSVHPFANIWCAVLERHAVRFAMQEKTHYLAIDHADVFEI